jgi:NAD(P)H-hydrate repair Nnr-like enzyme with NAD(P)H-hydrate dehydratase domain
VLTNLEKAQEERVLTPEEMEFKKISKNKGLRNCSNAKIASTPTFKANVDPQR